jgi:hypothetical protein
MSRFWVHDDAELDLEIIWDLDGESAGYLQPLLEQLETDINLRDRLTQEDFGVPGVHPFHVDAVDEHQRAGRNIWRLKAWNLDQQTIPYRVIYAYDHRNDAYLVLGILPREFAYDTQHERVREIVRLYDELGLSRIPGR